MVYHGIWVAIRNAIGYWSPQPKWSDYEYQRLRSWGLNAVNYIANWDFHLEPSETEPYVYEPRLMAELPNQIELALKNGIQPFIDISVGTGTGWTGTKGGDYVNFNQVDAAGLGGRDRYIALLKTIAKLHPKLGIDVWLFPYHGQVNLIGRNGEVAGGMERARILHQETLPALYRAVREETDAPIYVIPVWQGQWSDMTTGVYDMVEGWGWPFAEDRKLYLGFSNKGTFNPANQAITNGGEWNYNYARVDRDFQPLLNFKARHPNVVGGYVCPESIALRIHNGSYPEAAVRPVKQSRLNWARYLFEKMRQNDLSWSHFDLGWWYRGATGLGGYSILESDGHDSEVSLLMSEYAKIYPRGGQAFMGLFAGLFGLTLLVASTIRRRR